MEEINYPLLNRRELLKPLTFFLLGLTFIASLCFKYSGDTIISAGLFGLINAEIGMFLSVRSFLYTLNGAAPFHYKLAGIVVLGCLAELLIM